MRNFISVFVTLTLLILAGFMFWHWEKLIPQAQNPSFLDKTPYIYISTSHGQAMGRTFGGDTIYIGSDGYIQRIKENYGMSDTVQELKEGRLERSRTLKLFEILEKHLSGVSNNAPTREELLEKLESKPGQITLPEYYPPSSHFEMLLDNKTFFTKYSNAKKSEFEKGLKPLTSIIDDFLKEIDFIEKKANRFIRAHRIRNESTIYEYKKENLIKIVSLEELSKTENVLSSILNERRLIPIQGENPFQPLNFFRWPYKWPYTKEIELDGVVYSIRCKIRWEEKK